MCLQLIKNLLFIFLLIIGHNCFSQSGWKNRELLYRDPQIIVDLQFSDVNTGCDPGGESLTFRYRFNGYVVKEEKYITWKIDYISCNGDMYTEQKSIQIGGAEMVDVYGTNEMKDYYIPDPISNKIICSALVNPFYDVRITNSSQSGTKAKINLLSIDPKSIEGSKNILYGQSTNLSVKGGLLGEGANWIWYEKSCGGIRIGSGSTIKVNPIQTTQYFVRAEGKNNITACAQATVNVDLKSLPAEGIDGDANLCKGDKTILAVRGGHLGVGASWNWYSSENRSVKIGTGNSIVVAPIQFTTYYVRAEGTHNKTDYVTHEIQLWEKSIAPTSIQNSGSSTICEGEKVNLIINGGKLSDDAEWHWYKDYCGSYSIATGSVLTTTPASTTTYFARGEGKCHTTECKSITITVNNESRKPYRIVSPEFVFKNREAILEVEGGQLGDGANWYWSKGACSEDKFIGEGSQLTIKIKNPTKYFVRGIGTCNVTDCTELLIAPIKYISPSTYNHNGFLGIGIGFEYQEFHGHGFQTIRNGSQIQTSQHNFTIQGLGLTFELPYFPILNHNFSLGIIPTYTLGTSADLSGETDNSYQEPTIEYSYHNLQAEAEIAYGFQPVKLLGKFHISAQINKYLKTTDYGGVSSEDIYNLYNNRQAVYLGLRLGRFAKQNHTGSGNLIDLLGSISSVQYNNKLLGFNDPDNSISSWNLGTQLSWWSTSDLKIQFDAIFKSQLKSELNNLSNISQPTFRVSLLFTNRKL